MAVVAHGDAQYSTVVMVMDAGNDAGMEEIRLAVVDDDATEQM
jgi:biopolymer transport protein ExbD